MNPRVALPGWLAGRGCNARTASRADAYAQTRRTWLAGLLTRGRNASHVRASKRRPVVGGVILGFSRETESGGRRLSRSPGFTCRGRIFEVFTPHPEGEP